MKKHSRSQQSVERQAKPSVTVGMDLGDRYSHYCMLNQDGEVTEQGRIATTEKGMRKQFEGEPCQRIAIECGTHSPWISRLLKELGHEVIVANARKLRAISENESKSDEMDAEMLADLAYYRPRLLHPLRHRSSERQRDLNLLHVRDSLVRARTMLVNTARGLVKSNGGRLPACSTEAFAVQAKLSLAAEMKPSVTPLLKQVELLTDQIKEMEAEIEKMGERYAEIGLLRTVPGVGPIVAAAYVLTLDRADKIQKSRSVGAFLGLRPGRDQSGDSDPERGISKTGNGYLRRLLVQSAHYTLSRHGQESALREWGLGLAASGGKRGKKRAVVAVARKLSVILHAMWKNGEKYKAFPQASGKTAATTTTAA